MAVTRATVWVANDILTAAALNAEFDLFAGANGQAVSFPRTAVADFAGYTLILDADTDTTLRASVDDVVDIAIGGTDTFQFTATKLTILGKRVLTSGDPLAGMVPIVNSNSNRITELENDHILAARSFSF